MARLLLVDDDPDQLEVRSMVLEAEGHEVAIAEGADQAMEQATGAPPEAVVMDLRIPDVPAGLSLISWLRSRYPTLKIIVVSGWLNDLINRPEASMVNHMLQKPVKSGALVNLLRQCVIALLFLNIAWADFPFRVPEPAEVVADIVANSPGSDWSEEGREAALADLQVNGKAAGNLMVWDSAERTYSVFLGPLQPGSHRLSVTRNGSYSAAGSGLNVKDVKFRFVRQGSPDYDLIANAPIVYARPNTVGKFTDIPLLTYVERLPDHLQYSVIFSNEDGGTSTRALMARWGRTTDIEHVYRLWPGRAMIQAKGHEEIVFDGAREGLHPLLYISTDNNMISAQGQAPIRYQLSPVPVTLTAASREIVMDEHPFTYAVAAAELKRERKIRPFRTIDGQNIGDPRTYLYVEARIAQSGARLAARVHAKHQQASHLGRADYAIERPGWVRLAVEVGPGVKASDVGSFSFECLAEPPARDKTVPPGGSCTVYEVSRVFMLDEGHRPGKPIWRLPENQHGYQLLSGESLTWSLK